MPEADGHARARAPLADRLRLRKIEARLNALPQFITEIDGLDTCR
jgi:hypothetical protein